LQIVTVMSNVLAILANIGPIIGFLGVTRAVAPIFAKGFSILIQIPAVITKCVSIPLHLVAVAAEIIGKRRTVETSAEKRGMGCHWRRQQGPADQTAKNG